MQELAEEAGVRVVVEPKFGYVGQIFCPNGKVHYFRNTHFDLNPLGATEISRDKDYASFFMSEMGYPVIDGEAFYSKEWCESIGSDKGIDQAHDYARNLGFPVIVKPNSKSQGVGVYKVTNKTEFHRAIRRVFKIDHVALVQRVAEGNDYRIVVLDGRVISAYQRLPLTVVGDGVSTVTELHDAKQAEFQASERDTILKPDDFRLKLRLSQLRMNMQSVLPVGRSLQLLDNANLCSGGTSVDVTHSIHPDFAALCARLTADMGLRYCGVDLMVEGLLSEAPGKYKIIEINAAPGIDNYAAGGPEQEKIVRGLYLEVLKSVAEL